LYKSTYICTSLLESILFLDITLIFSENGKGVPADVDITKSKSLGFKLIFIFIKQLKGTYTISNENGFSICVKFKYSEN
jgi:two-component sensor histidine kinase